MKRVRMFLIAGSLIAALCLPAILAHADEPDAPAREETAESQSADEREEARAKESKAEKKSARKAKKEARKKARADRKSKKESESEAGELKGTVRKPKRGKSAERTFREDDVAEVREYFSAPENLQNLPPGLAKKEQLPPGLQRHLQKNGVLPPGLQNRLEPLPEDLESRLAPLPDGVHRGFIGDRVVLVEEDSGTVLDVIENVIPGAPVKPARTPGGDEAAGR